MNQLILALSLLFSLTANSEVLSRIEIKQKNAELQFKVTINNTSKETLKLLLTKDAQNLNLQVPGSQKNERYTSLTVEPLQVLQVQYAIEIQTDKTYFKTSADFWIPVLQNRGLAQKFSLQSDLDPEFSIIESATGRSQDDWAFVFGRFARYQSADLRLKIFLLKTDDALAKTLLEKLRIYLDQFEKELGPYPYSDFAVVESPEEIGYAFPKMTWMGSQVLRFPFILNTSLPHELLHSWWGNGVFVDYESGNWCEGLTAFGADYGLLDEKGKKSYRLKALSNYSNYVKAGNEISLAQFISRGEDRSLQAIGYDKAMMVFVMLEQQLGEKVFKEALRNFYQQFQFKKASYQDLFEVLEKTSSQDLDQFQKYWIHSTGFVKTDFLKSQKKKMQKSIVLEWLPKISEIEKIPRQPIQAQVQFNEPNKVQNVELLVNENGQELLNSLTELPGSVNPTTYSLDSEFYLFRELSELEKPVTFSRLFGSPEILIFENNTDFGNELKNVFPEKTISVTTDFDYSRPTHLIINLNQVSKSKKLLLALNEKRVRIGLDSIELSNQVFDLKENAVFLTLRVENSYVTVFQLNQNLPTLRWLQRWSRYGAQSVVILNSTSASFQDIWLDPFKRNF